jgi:hypothetical protein
MQLPCQVPQAPSITS